MLRVAEVFMALESKLHQSYPLRLSPSLRSQLDEAALREGISLNHFISMAIVEKLTRMEATRDRKLSNATNNRAHLESGK